MSKPSWKDAPDWANWLAQGQYGVWYWYKDKPKLFCMKGLSVALWVPMMVNKEIGMYQFAEDGGINPYWRSTLEARPCTPNT